MTQPPDTFLRARAAGWASPAMIDVVFGGDIARYNVEGAWPETLVTAWHEIAERLNDEDAWRPFAPSLERTHKVYAALLVRVNALRAWAAQLASVQRRRTEPSIVRRTAIAQARSAATSPDDAPDFVDDPPPDDHDVVAHYMHLWLDAHWLATLAVEELGSPPHDTHRWTTALLAAYAPSAETVFHEGELPNLVDRVRACSFFGEQPPSVARDPVTHMFSKLIPHRCVVRDVITNVEASCVDDEAVLYLVMSLLAASLLGVYRHARMRPTRALERQRVYKTFFYDPPAALVAAIEESRRSRGLRRSRVDDYERSLAPSVVASDTVVPASYASAVARKKKAAAAAAPSPKSAKTFDSVRRERTYAFLASVTVTRKGSSSQRRFINQDTVVNVFREHLVVVVERFLPHLYDELVRVTKWRQWQASVVDCMNMMRGAAAAAAADASAFKTVAPKLVPSKFVYTVEKQSFIEALAQECTSFLDAGRRRRPDATTTAGAVASIERPDGSETPMDAPLIAEVEQVLRTLVTTRYRHDSLAPPLMPTLRVPTDDDDFERSFAPRGLVPLTLFHATPSVVSEYVAAAINYDKAPSPGVPKALVYYLVKNTSMYQLQLVHAFVRAQIDARNVRTFALPRHIAEAQASVVRARLGLRDDQPIPLGALESFVCMQCREFRGVLITANDDALNELPMHGSENVAFASTSIDQQVAERLRRDGFPSWRRLLNEGRRYGTLFKYYQENAFIDGDTRVYPHDPTLFNAPETALDDAKQWLDAQRSRDVAFSMPVDGGGGGDGEPLVERTEHGGIAFDSLVAAPLVDVDTYETFLARWQQRNGEPFIVGHRPSDDEVASRAPVVVWTCASKRYKNEERKTRQVATAMHRVSDSITEQERATALRSANTRRRHDVRLYYERTLCSRRRVVAVSLLGMALRIDSTIIVACCKCTGFTTTDDMHWLDGLPVCTRCWRRSQTGSSIERDAMGVSAAVKCRKCRAPRRACEQYMSVVCYDDVSHRFVRVHLCPRHSKKKLWLLAAPNIHSLSTVDAGLSDNWKTLRSWQVERDYLRVRPQDNVDAFLAAAAGDEDGVDDGDDDDDAAADNEEPPAAAAAPRRRRVAADSRQQRKALVK